MQRRLREYLHQQRAVQMRMQAARAIPVLSPALQIEVIMYCHRYWLDTIWFVRPMENSCKVRLAMAMDAHVLAPGEVAAKQHLYVMSRGLVLYGGKVLSSGKVWGEDVVLLNQAHALPYMARAMTYVDLSCMHRERMISILVNFPRSYKVMPRCAISLALRRYLIRFARRFVDEYGDTSGSNRIDFMMQMQVRRPCPLLFIPLASPPEISS